MKYYYLKTAGSRELFEIWALIEIEKDFKPFTDSLTNEKDGIEVIPKKFIINKVNLGMFNKTLHILEEDYYTQRGVFVKIFERSLR
jgi:hypothetical protein